jgi:hypothetical protein
MTLELNSCGRARTTQVLMHFPNTSCEQEKYCLITTPTNYISHFKKQEQEQTEKLERRSTKFTNGRREK